MTGPRFDEMAVDTADRLHSAAIHVLRMLRAEDAALGLTAPKLSALSVLVFRGPLSVGELAAAEQRDALREAVRILEDMVGRP